jgi:ribosomal protein S27AE
MEIEHQCPQCGAPVILEEADRLFTCSFCRVKLYLSPKNYFRYYFLPAEPFGKEIIFVPYWRFRGMLFSCKTNAIEQRILDTSFLASNYKFLPPSLGLRAQALKLRVATFKEGTKFLRLSLSSRDFLSKVEKNELFEDSNEIENVTFHNACIGEVVSLIYSPIFIQHNTIFDAILNRPIATQVGERGDGDLSFEEKQNWGIRFLSTLCPNCGWDLIAEKESCVLICSNCNSLWEASGETLQRIEFGVISEKDGKNDVAYLPFWRMKIRVGGIKLQSYADLVRFANLPKVIKTEWEGLDIYFWSPAFKVSPALFLRLAQQLTISQPDKIPDMNLPKSSMYPITLPVSEAKESLKITLANIATKKKDIFPKLNEIKIELTEAFLIFLPFFSTNNEFIQPQLRFSIQKNALKIGKNI